MEAVRDVWTDERMDDLNHRVGEGFQEMREEFRALRLEMRDESRAVRSEMAAANRTTMQTILGGFAVMLVGFAGTVATILTQS